jgi:hypothetical protein
MVGAAREYTWELVCGAVSTILFILVLDVLRTLLTGNNARWGGF